MQRFSKRVALVTGGASGIGEAIARRLASEGATVCIADLNPKGTEIAGSLPGGATFHSLDVADFAAFEKVVNDVVSQHGKLDFLCNNAGTDGYGTSLSTSPEEWRRIMSVDLDGVFNGCKAALPHMLAAGGGAIVNTASMAGMGGFAGMVAYSAAKGGVINLTRTVALDHAAAGIRINAVCPGFVYTNMTAEVLATKESVRRSEQEVPMRRLSQPAETASVVAFLLSEDASYVTGCILPVDGGISCAIRQNVSD